MKNDHISCNMCLYYSATVSFIFSFYRLYAVHTCTLDIIYTLIDELWKMVRSILSSYTLPYMERTLSSSKCSYGYRPYTEMGVFQHLAYAISYVW